MLIFLENTLFSPKECQSIIEHYNTKSDFQAEAAADSEDTGGELVDFTRDLGSLHKYMVRHHHLVKAVNQKMQFDIGGALSYELGIIRYRVGSEVKKHIDNIGDGSTRKIVAITMLSPEGAFTGGEFFLAPGVSPPIPDYKLKQGQTIVFPAYYPHGMRKIISGERHIFISGFHGETPFK